MNLVDHVLEVYRDPSVDTSAPYGWSYRSVPHITTAGSATLLALPAVRIAVSDLLP